MENWLPLLGFAIAGSVTPGPNVLMVAAAAAGHGLRAVVPHMLGITFGFAGMVLLTGFGLAAPLAASPALHGVLRWAGAAWLVWLAWKIASAAPRAADARPPLGFLGAAGFQWVNPKAWMLVAAAIPTFTTEAAPLLPQVLAISAAFFVVQIPCLLVWAGIGVGAGRLLREPGRLRAFNIAMALLLVASLVPILR
ncbi:LysE family translocator [Falsiroseomonas sp. CW058]|uniref:LysE family translocator n=1 Tax=Falsiroseomonas sp. CW058 TaxID=3388664 RepID=UPI003D317E19